jgi:hypothetical protein
MSALGRQLPYTERPRSARSGLSRAIGMHINAFPGCKDVRSGSVSTCGPALCIRDFWKRQPIAWPCPAATATEAAQSFLYLMRGGYTSGQTAIVDGGDAG